MNRSGPAACFNLSNCVAEKGCAPRSGMSPGRPSMRTGFFSTISYSMPMAKILCRIAASSARHSRIEYPTEVGTHRP